LNWNLGPVWGGLKQKNARTLDPSVSYYGTSPVSTSEKFLVGDVLFAYDSDRISEDFKEVLKDLAQYLQSGGFKRLVVEGHTDSVGSEVYNQSLSERRAKAVVAYLTNEGRLPKDRVEAQGIGEARPVADNSNYQGRAKNRRVEFNVTR